jgi:Protein of unknown function (DUF2589)
MPNGFLMADQFRGLPMGDLIGGPLQAACDAQVRLALATANFIQQIGFLPPAADAGAKAAPVRTVNFQFDRPVAQQDPTKPAQTMELETVKLTVPLLAIVKVPALAITSVDITFDMEVKNVERSTETSDQQGKLSADASVGWGPFSLKVHVEGSVATHKENTRETDQTAKYHVEVKAEDKGIPEGLARVLDMMLTAIAPTSVEPKSAQPSPSPNELVAALMNQGSKPDLLDRADAPAIAVDPVEDTLYRLVPVTPLAQPHQPPAAEKAQPAPSGGQPGPVRG